MWMVGQELRFKPCLSMLVIGPLREPSSTRAQIWVQGRMYDYRLNWREVPVIYKSDKDVNNAALLAENGQAEFRELLALVYLCETEPTGN